MRVLPLSTAAVVLMATTTHAATIGPRWQDTPAAQKHNGPGTVEVWVDMLPGEEIAAANADAVCVWYGCDDLRLDTWASTVPNWLFVGNDGSIGAPDYAGAFNGALSAADTLVGPMTGFVIGTFDVSFTGAADGSEVGFGLSWHNNPGGGVIDANAISLTWDTRYNTVYSGYVAYGDYGSPGWGNHKGNAPGLTQPANPLIITKVPEPTGLALVALGGCAQLRRARWDGGIAA